ncbi:MAG: hypothetical protein FJ100_17885 [Deltaproteobacteria bacterium]|nr:hypothetical protein [Deltaproteobacteria bacterium]
MTVHPLPAWVEPRHARSLAEASARLRAWSLCLHGDLRAAFEAMAATTGAGAAQGAEAYLSPVSQPVVLLPLWLSAGLADQVVVDLLGSALAGYLAVRVQDDWCDRGTGDARCAMVLSAALLARHAALAGQHAVGQDYWKLHADHWERYATAMSAEQHLAAGDGAFGEAEFQRVLDRSRPVVLPGAAALALTGRWNQVHDLASWVDAVVAAHQRFDDLRDGLEDLQAGLRTMVLAQSGARTPGQWVAWLASGGASVELAMADRELAQAQGIAQRMGMPEAAPWISARRAAMVAWQARWQSGPLAGLIDLQLRDWKIISRSLSHQDGAASRTFGPRAGDPRSKQTGPRND